MKILIIPLIIFSFFLPGGSGLIYAQEITANQLADALQNCNQNLKASMLRIDSLKQALKDTEALWEHRKVYTDSLNKSLAAQITIQDSISKLMEANVTIMDSIVVDYSNKFDEINDLYVKELRKQADPWWLNGKGWKGFFYGIFFGGAMGATFALLK